MEAPVSTASTPSTRRLALRVALVGGLFAGALLPATIRSASAGEADVVAEEQQFVRLINELRASKGAQPLVVNVELTRVARDWTKVMKNNGKISHNPMLKCQVKEDWNRLGENVGTGPSVEGLHEAFVKSPGHYKNLVEPSFDSVAVTIEYAKDEYGNDTIFVTEQFMDMDETKKPNSVDPDCAAAGYAPSNATPEQLALKPPAKKPAKKVAKKTKKTTATAAKK